MPASHRVYHRFSTFTPDQLSFINYLTQRGYSATLKVFEEEINSQQQQYGLSMGSFIDRQEITDKQFWAWVEELKKSFHGTQRDLMKMEFMLLVWKCSRDRDRLDGRNVDQLKHFIEKNGVKLSQFEEILPYFALPYIKEPWHHPFLSKIYTDQWNQQIKELIYRYCNVPIQNKGRAAAEESEWLKVVKDLIEICNHFDTQCQAKNAKHLELLERVRKYQRVIEENDGSILLLDESMKPSELSRIVYKPEANESQHLFPKSDRSIHSVSSEDPIYPTLSYHAVKAALSKWQPGKPQTQQEAALVYYALHQRIVETRSTQGRRDVIHEYIQQDIFRVEEDKHPNPSAITEIECLRLMNTMCYCGQFVEYIGRSQWIMDQLVKTIDNSKKHYTNVDHFDRGIDASLQAMEERLFLCFALLQKLSFRREAYNLLRKTNLAEVLIFEYLGHYQLLSNEIMYYILALLLNILLRHEGKVLCSSFRLGSAPGSHNKPDKKHKYRGLFELMVEIWKFIGSSRPANVDTVEQDQQSQLYSFIYSIFYVLLTLNVNKRTARAINFIQQIEKFAQGSSDDSYKGIITHMREVLDKPEEPEFQEQDEIDNGDEDLANIDDEVDEEGREQVWMGDRCVRLEPKLAGNAELALQKYYQANVKKKLQQQLHISFVEAENSKRTRNPARISIKTDSRRNQLKENKPSRHNDQDTKVQYNLSQQHKIEGYDPNKYQAWKRMKSSHG